MLNVRKIQKEKIRRTVGERVFLSVMFVIFTVYAISLLFPFVWIGYNSLKLDGYEDFVLDVWGLPKDPMAGLQNYKEVFLLTWSGYNFFDMTLNTIEYVAIMTLIGTYLPMQTAYVISKYEFKLRKLYYAIAIATISIPLCGGLASMIILLSKLKLYGSYLGIYLMGATGFGGSFLLFYSYFRNLSWSYAEAAFMDGAGHFRVFLFINLPMALPIMVAVTVMAFIGTWNDYFNVYMYAHDRPTLSVGVQFLGETMVTRFQYPKLFAFMMVSMIPGLLIFSIFQNTIMNNFSLGGLKG